MLQSPKYIFRLNSSNDHLSFDEYQLIKDKRPKWSEIHITQFRIDPFYLKAMQEYGGYGDLLTISISSFNENQMDDCKYTLALFDIENLIFIIIHILVKEIVFLL